ncbi:hypothetical protein NDU88_007029 [Pleurodeles waltl]|uniref:Uncharacterized protein n=1 Tax=Pleurodeles waltl TaxID=8319 RepID=A0AAV7QMV2_PLEWA|nr:hypothetical protein NDU88_007029 [Pleurodeles waltl]
MDVTLRCPGGTSTVAHSPVVTSGASFSDPDVVYPALRDGQRLDRAGPFKSPAEEIQGGPPSDKKTELPTEMLEEEETSEQRSIGRDDQEAAGR